MTDVLRDIIARNRAGQAVAIPSVCSAQPDVLRASLLRAQVLDRAIVIEATSNQVNQEGGYTGMTPADFIRFVQGVADDAGVERDRITFGGDHLGPQAWRSAPADVAMAKAQQMVADYVQAGFTKIHLDCSEGCAGEPAQLDDATAASRSATLAAACGDTPDLMFVIGTEVPPPGGARTDDHGDIAPTTPAAATQTLRAHHAAFTDAGLAHLIPQIGGLVVQPGVEFTPMQVHHLPSDRDPGLRAALDDWPGVTLEAHSTDYQTPATYYRLAELGFGFHKVGPALTFAYRQALYALDTLRRLAGWGDGDLPGVMEAVMLADPRHWQGHYRGDADALRLQRHFGLADRIRYYWPTPEAQTAVAQLLHDMNRPLPDVLLPQAFGPAVLERAAALGGDPVQALIDSEIQIALDPYLLTPAAEVTQ